MAPRAATNNTINGNIIQGGNSGMLGEGKSIDVGVGKDDWLSAGNTSNETAFVVATLPLVSLTSTCIWWLPTGSVFVE